MAGRRQQQVVKHAAHRLFAPPASVAACAAGLDADELEESDVWACPVEPRRQAEFSKPVSSSRPSSERKKESGHEGGDCTAASSLPVNIPDWSKILGNDNGGSHSITKGWWEEEAGGGDDDDGKQGGAAGPVIPPHELVWRSRAASFSVHEGAGRTLKGRDLSRVRNAIWEKIGFQD